MQRLKTGGVMVPLDTAAAALCFAAQRGVLGGGGGSCQSRGVWDMGG